MKGVTIMVFIRFIVDIIFKTLFDPDVVEKAKKKPGAFTRNRGKLPYSTVVKLLMQNSKQSISSALESFF